MKVINKVKLGHVDPNKIKVDPDEINLVIGKY